MDLQVFKPKNEQLKKYIKNYYIFQQNKNEKTTYLTFPNPNSIVSVLNKVDLKHSPNQINVNHNPNNSITSDLTLSYKKPILINYNGIVKEISICFKPLGINAFISKAENTISEKDFFPYLNYKEKMTELFHLSNNENIISDLEKYLLSKLSNFTHPFLYHFIDILSKNPNTSLHQFSNQFGISQKTLIKHAKIYLYRTPSEFRRSLRFYQALNEYIHTQGSPISLTSIGYAAHFFDQAHMIRDFKALTGYTPKQFFNYLKSINGELNWIYL